MFEVFEGLVTFANGFHFCEKSCIAAKVHLCHKLLGILQKSVSFFTKKREEPALIYDPNG
jgi:hypothetical protein